MFCLRGNLLQLQLLKVQTACRTRPGDVCPALDELISVQLFSFICRLLSGPRLSDTLRSPTMKWTSCYTTHMHNQPDQHNNNNNNAHVFTDSPPWHHHRVTFGPWRFKHSIRRRRRCAHDSSVSLKHLLVKCSYFQTHNHPPAAAVPAQCSSAPLCAEPVLNLHLSPLETRPMTQTRHFFSQIHIKWAKTKCKMFLKLNKTTKSW